MTTYAIAGASGQLGRLAADGLLSRVHPSDVVLLTRTPAALNAFADRGAQIRAADLADPASMRAALTGVDRLLLISAALVGAPRRLAQRHAVDAAREAGVTFVAYTSAPRPAADNPSLVIQDHFDTEQYLRGSGLRWAMLRNNIYADLVPDSIEQAIRDGELVTNQGAGRAAYVARADCAAAATAVLADTDSGTGPGGHDYEITGAESLDAYDLADLASARAVRRISVRQVDDATLRAGLLAGGLPELIADVVTTFGTAVRDGLLADVHETVHELTGTSPSSVRELLSRAAVSRS